MSVTAKQVEEIMNKLSSLEVNEKEVYTELRTLQRDNISLQKDVLQAQKENELLKKKVDGLEDRDAQLSKENAVLRQKLNSLSNESKEVKDQMTQFQDMRRVFNRALVETHDNTDLRTEVGTLVQRTEDIEEILTRNSQSATHVSIGPSFPLVKGKLLRLDNCAKVTKNGGYFDINTCCLNPQIDGTYGLHVVFRQKGDGRLRMFVKGDNGLDIYVGKTSNRNDISSTMRVCTLKKGEKVWIEICLDEGDASLRWCSLSTWLF